jgi:copper chaperone
MNEIQTITLKIAGMTCQGCARSVSRVLRGVKGVASAEVALESAEAMIAFNPEQVTPAQLKAAVYEAGYEVS